MPSRLAIVGSSLAILNRAVLGKALPSILTETGFIQELLREAWQLSKVVKGSVDDVMPRVRRSTNINWRGATAKQRQAAVDEMGNLLKGLPSEFSPGVSVVLDERGRIVNVKTKRALKKKHKSLKVNTTFAQIDRVGVETLRDTTSIFFGPEYERQANRFRSRAQATIADGLEAGFGRREIARDLQREFGTAAAHESYWQTVAAVHVNRARSFSSAVAYADAGVEEYEILAVRDSRTTVQCLFMDGKTFKVGLALDQFETLEAAKSLEEVKNEAMPFLGLRGDQLVLPSGRTVAQVTEQGFKQRMSDKQLNAVGIHMPPFHHACRTSVVPVI